jgi:UDP-2,4-diacetamido-2,4,6-trideoxy-beta-L-altropyranose hydrolase
VSDLFVFRVDSSSEIGAGHVMRCLTLANALRQEGATCQFICRDHPGNIADKIREEGHGLTMLALQDDGLIPDGSFDEDDYSSWLGADIREDAKDTCQYLCDKEARWLIVDHYAIDEEWESRVKDAVAIRLFAIDDQANRRRNCDALLDPEPSREGAGRWKGRVPNNCELFVGPRYSLLRPEFLLARKRLRPVSGEIRRIFIGFGGVDAPNATQVALDAVLALRRDNLAIDAVIGAANQNAQALMDKYSGHPNVTLHINSSNVAQLMAAADLAISGGGGMMMEQCYLRLPAVTVSIAKNQEPVCQQMDELGINIHLGDLESIDTEVITATVKRLLKEPQQLRQMAANSDALMKHDGSQLTPFLLGAVSAD